MTIESDIHAILIDRDVETFVRRDWAAAEADFDVDQFCGYSAESGSVQLTYPTLAAYRDAWLAQAARFANGDAVRLSRELRAVQRLERVEVADGRAMAVKVFAGEVHDSSDASRHLAWTTLYFLRFDHTRERWLITGFLGYLPSDWTLS